MDYLRTLDEMISHLPQCVIVRARQEILFANKMAAQTFGFATPRDMTAWSDVSALLGNWEPAADSEGRRLAYFTTAQGDLFMADIIERALDFRGQPAVQITFIGPDLKADRLRDERLLIERYGLALRQSGVGIWDHDRHADKHYFSPTCREILGIQADDKRGYLNLFEDLIYPDDRQMVRAACGRAFSERATYHAQFRILRGGGDVRWISASGNSLHDRDGLVTRLAGVMIDITEHKQRERELHEARKTALAGLEAKSRFVSGLSHEFRTPIHALMALPRLMRQQAIRPELADLVEASELAGEHLLALVDSALDLSGIESGSIEIQTGPFALADSCQRVCEAMRPRLRTGQMDIELVIDPMARANFLGDEKQFSRTLLAMLRHAITRSGPGVMRLKLSAGENGHGVLIILEDVGAPYASSDARILFEPFSSIQTPDNPIRQSNGIDLPLARKLARAMGGDVTIATRGAQSGSLQFYLPLERVAGDLDGQIELVEQIRPLHILVVEDNLVNQRIIAVILEQLGHACVIVPDGVMCLEAITKARFDLILMDLHMPNLNGYDTTRRIRALESELVEQDFRPMPIIALTADARPETRLAAMDAGMTGFLNKPISIPELYEALAPIAANLPDDEADVRAND